MNSGDAAVRELAPAKINLFLHIVGRRPDGMHLIDSLVVFADVGDVVTAAPDERLSLTRTGPMAGDLPPVEDDLVYRAATLLAGVNYEMILLIQAVVFYLVTAQSVADFIASRSAARSRV